MYILIGILVLAVMFYLLTDSKKRACCTACAQDKQINQKIQTRAS